MFSPLSSSQDKCADASLSFVLQPPSTRFSTTEQKLMIHNKFHFQNVRLIDQTNFSVRN